MSSTLEDAPFEAQLDALQDGRLGRQFGAFDCWVSKIILTAGYQGSRILTVFDVAISRFFLTLFDVLATRRRSRSAVRRRSHDASKRSSMTRFDVFEAQFDALRRHDDASRRSFMTL